MLWHQDFWQETAAGPLSAGMHLRGENHGDPSRGIRLLWTSSIMNTHLELGLDTFGDVTRTADGTAVPHAQVIRDVIAEAVLADRLGIDFIGVGEHHRDDFAISA